MIPLNLIRIKNLNILDQLRLEEALLRASDQNFCLINEGTSPALVLGLSQNPQEYVDLNNAKQDNILIIKRFSGGGAVFVDKNTLFVSFIFAKKFFSFNAYPEHILNWSSQFYKEVLNNQDFKLLDRDYTIASKKLGGNAQYITKDRWLHHTSFLIDFDIALMEKYLLHPKKEPLYREKRSHNDFLTPLSKYIAKEKFLKNLVKELEKIAFVKTMSLQEGQKICELPHRKATCLFF